MTKTTKTFQSSSSNRSLFGFYY